MRRAVEYPSSVLGHPAIQRLRRIAVALGDLVDDVVFIGGAIAPLLQTRPPFASARQTKDVDGVMSSTAYADVGRVHAQLRAAGFRQAPEDAGHVHRWRSPADELFDLVPSGAHLGGTGQVWDTVAIESHEVADLGGGVTIRHASACAFVALKWAAHADRGDDDPYNSRDLEDILALVASRPTIADETNAAGALLRPYLMERFARLWNDPRLKDLLAGHLNNADDRLYTMREVTARLELIARIEHG